MNGLGKSLFVTLVALCTPSLAACDSGDGDTDSGSEAESGTDSHATAHDSDTEESGDHTSTSDTDGGDGDGDGDADTTSETGDGDSGGTGQACQDAPLASAGGSPMVGGMVAQFEGVAVDGSAYNVCDMAGEPFLFIISAGWCGPCQDLATGLSGGSHGFGPGLDAIRDALPEGEVGVLEFLVDDYDGAGFGPANAEFLMMWESLYHNEHVQIMGDPAPAGVVEDYWTYFDSVHNGGVPSGAWVNADFTWNTLGLSEGIAAGAAHVGG